jgi:hypothetical protein
VTAHGGTEGNTGNEGQAASDVRETKPIALMIHQRNHQRPGAGVLFHILPQIGAA